MFRKILVANRGEIAVRIQETCRRMGIKTVAVYSEADREAPHVLAADEAVCLGPPAPARSYLSVAAILRAARTTGADAIHPGYGFLSESPEFAAACQEERVVFIGPPLGVIRQMGNKRAAREIMAAAGVPVVAGSPGDVADLAEAAAAAAAIGYPVMVKPSAGGGGIGMGVATDEKGLARAVERARVRAERAFGNAAVYLEKYISPARHVEVQVLADRYGRVVHLFERECSVQRRYQKLIEETPSPALDDGARAGLVSAGVRSAQAVGYVNAGTVEFLMDAGRRFYFLEMNTRLQVEHPVTEMVTGLDLVEQQIRVAAGEALAFDQDGVRAEGHAIECRVYAEDPVTSLPSPGRITAWKEPAGEFVRVDSGVAAGTEVTPFYDPLLAKVVVWDRRREGAIARMEAALKGFVVDGVRTNIPLLLRVLHTEAFRLGAYHTGLAAEVAGRE